MAGELYEEIGQYEEATKCYLNMNQFEKAKNCLMKIRDPEVQKQLQLYFDDKYNQYLKSRGEAEKLIGNQEISEGLEIMIQRKDWMQVFQITSSKSTDLYNFYLLRYLKTTLEAKKYQEAVQMLQKFEMPFQGQNVPLYKKLIMGIFWMNQQSEIGNLQNLLRFFVNQNEHIMD